MADSNIETGPRLARGTTGERNGEFRAHFEAQSAWLSKDRSLAAAPIDPVTDPGLEPERPSLWRDRINRYGLLLAAPFRFVWSKSYRRALYLWLLQVDDASKTSVEVRHELPEFKRTRRVNLVLEPTACAISIFVSDFRVASTPSGSDEVFALVAALSRAGQSVRIIALDHVAGPHELQFRSTLMDRFNFPKVAQRRLEVLDAAVRPLPCGQEDLLVAADSRAARLLGQAFVERELGHCLYYLVSPADSASEALPESFTATYDSAGAHLSLCPRDFEATVTGLVREASAKRRACGAVERNSPISFDHVSEWGLGYRVLKSWSPEAAPKRVCLFVHFDPDGRIDPYVHRYLKALKSSGQDIILISSSDLDEETFGAVDHMVAGAICRENVGLDFCGWALALDVFPRAMDAEQLIIANDSVYGPVGSLDTVLEIMSDSGLDVWGGVESMDIERHFQSWFVSFSRAAIQSDAFQLFWHSIMPLTDKRAIICNYEVPMLRLLNEGGLKVGSAVPSTILDIDLGNPTMQSWRRLLDLGLPFVKVQLLRDNPVRVDIDGWTEELAARGYPPDLVLQHLRRVAGRSAAGLQTQ